MYFFTLAALLLFSSRLIAAQNAAAAAAAAVTPTTTETGFTTWTGTVPTTISTAFVTTTAKDGSPLVVESFLVAVPETTTSAETDFTTWTGTVPTTVATSLITTTGAKGSPLVIESFLVATPASSAQAPSTKATSASTASAASSNITSVPSSTSTGTALTSVQNSTIVSAATTTFGFTQWTGTAETTLSTVLITTVNAEGITIVEASYLVAEPTNSAANSVTSPLATSASTASVVTSNITAPVSSASTATALSSLQKTTISASATTYGFTQWTGTVETTISTVVISTVDSEGFTVVEASYLIAVPTSTVTNSNTSGIYTDVTSIPSSVLDSSSSLLYNPTSTQSSDYYITAAPSSGTDVISDYDDSLTYSLTTESIYGSDGFEEVELNIRVRTLATEGSVPATITYSTDKVTSTDAAGSTYVDCVYYVQTPAAARYSNASASTANQANYVTKTTLTNSEVQWVTVCPTCSKKTLAAHETATAESNTVAATAATSTAGVSVTTAPTEHTKASPNGGNLNAQSTAQATGPNEGPVSSSSGYSSNERTTLSQNTLFETETSIKTRTQLSGSVTLGGSSSLISVYNGSASKRGLSSVLCLLALALI
jgi:hypothetical protein